MDPFNFPAVGDPRAVGSKFGSSSGTSTDIIFPVSKQIDEAFQPGRTLELAWKSDQHRFWSPKNTRLFVEYELMYGEVDDTCADVATGPADGTGAPPSRSLRMTSMPNSTLFDSQVRYVCNNTVVEQSNYYSDLCQAQLLTTSNIEGTNTSASGMLTSLRKDTGVPTGVMHGQQRKSTMGDGYELCPVVAAPYVTEDDATAAKVALGAGTTLGNALAAITKSVAAANGLTVVDAVAAGADEHPIIKLKLSSTEATARLQADVILKAGGGAGLLVRAATGGGTGTFGATGTTSEKIGNVDVAADADGNFAGADAEVTLMDVVKAKLEPNDIYNVTVDPDNASEKPGQAPLANVASTLAVKVKSDAGKGTTPNPKSQILQQGYHPTTRRSTVQVSEPVMLSSWGHPWAMPSSSHQLFLTISPNWAKDLLYDPSGQYGCPGFNGEAQLIGPQDPATVKKNTVYVRIKDVSLHVAYVHPVDPYIPNSISIKTNPVTIAKRQLVTDTVQETFVVPPGTRSVLLFLVQDIHHLCADFELDGRAKAGAGVNALGITNNATGKFEYFSRAQDAIRDKDTDPRVLNIDSSTNPDYGDKTAEVKKVDGTSVQLEKSAPAFWTDLQVQLGQDVQPREQLAQQDPTKGAISRAWTLYTEFIAKSSGFRGSVMSFADFSGYLNANFSSGARCGSRGPFHMFNIQNRTGTLSSDLQVRGSLSMIPNVDAKQFLVVMAISESMFDISYQKPSPVPVVTRVMPLS